jgi:radical SAM protein with 4Fe4S-binding SPASM domain
MTLNQPLDEELDDPLETLKAHHPEYASSEIDPECQKCQWLSVCGTGCPVTNTEHGGRPNARSPFCEAYKEIIPAWIDAYGRSLVGYMD